jgi:cation transporter-like permease
MALLPPFLKEQRHHWKARAMLNKEFREMFFAEIISLTGGLLAGAILASYINKILLIPGLFILLPGFLEMRGNISGSLAARLSTALDLKKTPAKIIGNKLVNKNIIATFIEALVVALSLATIAYFVTYFVFGTATFEIFLVALIATILANFIESILTVCITFGLFKRGFDPTNTMGPYVTTSGDIVSVISLLAAIVIIAWI